VPPTGPRAGTGARGRSSTLVTRSARPSAGRRRISIARRSGGAGHVEGGCRYGRARAYLESRPNEDGGGYQRPRDDYASREKQALSAWRGCRSCGRGGRLLMGTDATTGATETRDGNGTGVAPEREVNKAAAFDPELERQPTPLSPMLPGFGPRSSSGGCSIGRSARGRAVGGGGIVADGQRLWHPRVAAPERRAQSKPFGARPTCVAAEPVGEIRRLTWGPPVLRGRVNRSYWHNWRRAQVLPARGCPTDHNPGGV
jgi:hypothetical protein